MLNVAKIILGIFIGIIALQFWYGFCVYSKRKIPPQIATIIQMHILTLTSLGLLLKGSLWFIFIGILFWFLSGIIVYTIVVKYPAKKQNLPFILPAIYGILFSYNIAINNNWDLHITALLSVIITFILKKVAEIIGAYFYFKK